MNRFKFFVESIKNIKKTGTITKSSQVLCRSMIKHIDFDTAKCIVELGAGDGVITKHILDAMRPDAVLIAFEVHAPFWDLLEEINDPRLVIAKESAEYIKKYINLHNFEKADYVVSGLPIVNLPKDLGYRIVQAAHDNLKKDGVYSQFHYSLLAKKVYKSVFGNVKMDLVPLNIPPAIVMRSIKK